MITATKLTKYFGRKKAIEDISFEIEKGEIVGFLGANAAGKTTTMRILTGYFPPTSGEAAIGGKNIFEHAVEVKKQIGYLPENVPLYPDMKIEEYLDFVAEAKSIAPELRKKRIAAVMEQCGLEPERHTFLGKLSKGYKQRVGIAQAIINNPSVLILDEPTVGLDPNQVVEIRSIIKTLGENATVMLSSHILEEVSKTCSRVIIINKGKVLTSDTPENLAGRLEKSTTVYLEVGGDPDKLEKILSLQKGVSRIREIKPIENNLCGVSITTEKDPEIRRQLLETLVEKDFAVYEMRTHRLSLEEIFTQIVKEGGTDH